MAVMILINLILMWAVSAAENPWTLLDEVYGRQELCEAFVHGSVLKFERETCAFNCEKWLYSAQIQCGAGEAQLVFTKDKDGKVFSNSVISATAWAQANGNPLRLKAATVESFGQIFVLESVAQSANGNLVAKFSVQSRRVDGSQKVVGEGFWEIVDDEGPAQAKTLLKEYTNKTLFNEATRDRLQN